MRLTKAAQREYMARYREARRRRGLCTSCGLPVRPRGYNNTAALREWAKALREIAASAEREADENDSA